jgi:hypothetical protein
MDAVDCREAHEILDRELQRSLDQAVDEECVSGRVDGRDASVVDFVVQGRGGNDAARIMERGHTHGHGRGIGGGPAHRRFELRAEAVGRGRASRRLGGIGGHRIGRELSLGRMEGTHTAERQTTYGPSQTPQDPAPGQTHGTTRPA